MEQLLWQGMHKRSEVAVQKAVRKVFDGQVEEHATQLPAEGGEPLPQPDKNCPNGQVLVAQDAQTRLEVEVQPETWYVLAAQAVHGTAVATLYEHRGDV